MALAHDKIKIMEKDNDNDEDRLVFLCTESPKAVNFYKKNGYKVFIKIDYEKDYKFYGLIYHWNEEFLNKAVNTMKEIVVFDQKLNWRDHILFFIKHEIAETCLFLCVYPIWIITAIICKILSMFEL